MVSVFNPKGSGSMLTDAFFILPNTSSDKIIVQLKLPMTGFEPGSTIVGDDRSVQPSIIFLKMDPLLLFLCIIFLGKIT